MSKIFKDPLLIACATGANTIAISTINYCAPSPELRTYLLAIAPIICNAIIFGFSYWIASNYVKSPEHLAAENAVNAQIDAIKKNIKEATDEGLCTKDFKVDLIEAMKARAKIPMMQLDKTKTS